MWYFSWILGIGVALAFAVINGMWLELYYDAENIRKSKAEKEVFLNTDELHSSQ
ncbi:Cytochrome bd ubiquinol oxidase subunit X [Candidatus Vallotia tarda]|uniref:Cytochrome bd ubiquinol oxidase subunit X n=1 Tax=Candidatus Vallotiella hemipterorum TaxID=1177213 RepID=A0A916JTD4_9BURK|nr:Cytochrome bd ubiquinol oxidase subunit X [Candidatus Vallotia tarda]